MAATNASVWAHQNNRPIRMKILLFAKNGQVGWELQRALAPLGELIALDKTQCDLSNSQQLQQTLSEHAPQIIVNASAYTAVDKAEEEPELAHAINATAPAIMASQAKQLGALLVHYSTDYVFSGEGTTPWLEDDITSPQNTYGKTKREGEEAIEQSGCNYLIFRTSWVYAARSQNFIAAMHRLMAEREALGIVSDQIGVPTSAELIADVSAHAIVQTLQDAKKCGIYHLTASGETSWYDYAKLIADELLKAGVELKITLSAIKPIKTSEYPTPAKRPLNSRLNTQKIAIAFNLTMPNWQQGVKRAIAEKLSV